MEKMAFEDAAAPGQPAASGIRRGTILRALGLLAFLAALAVAASLPPVRGFWMSREAEIERLIDACGIWAPIAFSGGAALLIAAGIPRMAFFFIAGAVFGILSGFLLASIATVAGFSAVFFAVRTSALRRLVLERFPASGKMAAMLRRDSIPSVILFRQLPLPGLVLNIALGMSTVGWRPFLLGTLAGIVPLGLPMSLLGAGFGKKTVEETAFYLVGSAILIAVAWIACGAWTRRLAAAEAAGSSFPARTPAKAVES
jgi:uncharacterized membrane protein YdjX (TVP38/TMEM64 family)